MPLGAATHAALAAYAPEGLVETVQARWQGPLDALQKYEARGRAVQLAVAAQPAGAASAARAGTPGIRGAALDFDLTQAGGKGRLQVQHGALEFPGVFEEPLIPVDELSADLQWQINGPSIAASVTRLQFANEDAQGDARISWRTGDAARARFPGVLDLQANISRANGARVYRYLPLGVPKTARDYVRQSVLQGSASGARFRVKGDLREFPFRNPKQGEFRIRADVHDVTYAFVPHSTWPALTQLSGELLFEGNGMQVKGASGRFAGASGLQVTTEAQITDFRSTVVGVTGLVRGPLGQQLGIVNGSPLAAIIGPALGKATASGNADVNLKLELPIAALDKSKVQGSVFS